MDEHENAILSRIEQKLKDISIQMEKLKLVDYVELLENPLRMLWLNFIGGLARGFGMAIGFTLLGALFLYILQKIIIWKLPMLSDFIADLIKLVKLRL